MNRTTIGVVLIAALAVMGLGLTAATLTTSYSSDISTGGQGDGVGNGEATDPNVDTDQDTERVPGGSGEGQNPMEIPQYCVEILTEATGILGLVVGFGLIVGIAYWQRGFVASVLAGYLIGLPLLIAYGLLTQCPTPGDDGSSQSALVEFITQSGMTEALTTTTLPTPILAAIFVIATIAALGALVLVSGSEEIQPAETDADDEPGLDEFAAVAGQAADRIESTDASVDNAVYRAWQEMTELLEMDDPDTSTPGQFAVAAVDAGLDEANVNDLTQLFEEVRYGDMDPEPREELAVETLRGIERTYSGATTDTAGTVTDDRTDGEDDRIDGEDGRIDGEDDRIDEEEDDT